MQKPETEILSIIPARSGSTEIKNKNIRNLGGKPLIYYTIDASLKSNVTRTIVSTDDPKIANIAKKYGAEVPFLRPKKYALKNSPSISVILHCLSYLKNENYFPDYVVFLQPTSPFRTYVDINMGIKKIMKTNATSLIGLVEVHQHPLWMFKKLNNDKMKELLKLRNKPLRRQDLPKLYYVNDALYISKTQYFKSVSIDQPAFDLHDLIGLEMSTLHSFDINTELDFYIATCLYKFSAHNVDN